MFKILKFVMYKFLKFNSMNTDEKQSSNVPMNEISKNQILNIDDYFINPKDPDEDEEEDVDDENFGGRS